ncbi:MAG: 4Fe-4S dicluster domain-containing protein [Chloroflexi bacterium]|nr:4Fe-4S dicluster domain-containing protein [Chloroflexota bacterium]
MSRGSIILDQSRCKGCALCTALCPQDVLAIDREALNGAGYHPAALVDPLEKCTGCAVCALVCPEVCITVYRAPVMAREARVK